MSLSGGNMKRFVAAIILFLVSGLACAGALDALSNKDAAGGLKEALTQGVASAVSKLGRENGFYGNEAVKIPLPDTLKKAEGVMRTLGMGKQADELVLAMNRAAEAATPEAKSLLLDAVKKMTVQDAKGILTGGDQAATEYFRSKTAEPLARKFLPIVKKATSKVGLAEKYNKFAQKGVAFGLVEQKDASIEDYVTRKTLDGLYAMIAAEERAIRADPLGQSGKYIQKVFGALRN